MNKGGQMPKWMMEELVKGCWLAGCVVRDMYGSGYSTCGAGLTGAA
jgi:hypothetical protein